MAFSVVARSFLVSLPGDARSWVVSRRTSEQSWSRERNVSAELVQALIFIVQGTRALSASSRIVLGLKLPMEDPAQLVSSLRRCLRHSSCLAASSLSSQPMRRGPMRTGAGTMPAAT